MASDDQSVSLETASTSLTEESTLNISFEDLNYTVRQGIFKRGHKTILKDLSGTFNSGELTVIMGQSGAGKSTLMDILAGYRNQTGGRIYVNNRLRNNKWFRRRSCYILQDDKVQDMLTIRESLVIAAELKLGNHISKEQKATRVTEIITSLNLMNAADTRAGNLSGGQKKRLAVGLELVSDPPVMFLDEPTSGLDSSISKQIVYLLHRLAQQGRTIVITMHQPSAALLRMVDRMYAVVAGRCAYMGSVPNLLPFLANINLICPKFNNPLDFYDNERLTVFNVIVTVLIVKMNQLPNILEKCSEQAAADKLVEYSDNGRDVRWIHSITQETDEKLLDTYNIELYEEVGLTTLPPPKEDPTSKILLALKSTYATSPWNQFTTLTRRSLLAMWRDPQYTLMITGIHCAMALFVGFLFFDIGQDAKYIRDNFNFLYFSLMFLMFTAFSAVSITFPEQLPVVRRENFNRWYTPGAYYASTLVSALPTQTVCTLSFACIVYWLTGQPPDIIRFSVFCAIQLMVSYVALCVGLLNGAVFNSVKLAVIFGPFFIMPFVVFSGFFLRFRDAAFIFHWLFHISFLKHGFTGICLTIFGMGRAKLPCSDMYCHYTYPSLFLQDSGMSEDKYSVVIIALIAIASVVILCSYVVLKIRFKYKW